MSYNAFAAPLRLELNPSRLRRHWRWLSHVVVAATLPMLQSLWLIATVMIVLLLSLYRSRTEPNITLLWHSDGRWTWFEDGSGVEVTLVEAPFIHPWLVILAFRTGNQRRVRRMAIFMDMLPASGFRRLCVRLRMTKACAI